MSQNKTTATDGSVPAFLDAVTPARRRDDALALDALFREATGWSPVMWGPSIVGYGSYHYVYDSGREGDMCATGFSPRKSNLAIYIMPGYADYGPLLADLGKHRLGKSCLYLNKLADVHVGVLKTLIQTGITDLGKKWPVTAT